jgi:O-acetyl-ADP-ribose deacetylase (regulator of RNase III)
MVERRIGNSRLRLVKGDITDLEIDAFVFDITADGKLGSGFGSAIQQRGGIIIQKELDTLGGVPTGEAVVTQAGKLKASHIIHTNGPKFREPDEEPKLRAATEAALRAADERGIKSLAFPAIGTGLYQVPIDLCVRTMVDSICAHLGNGSGLEEVVIAVADTREYEPFAARIQEGA